ncbi:NAD-dependent epimerase/dehydratase family protein [Thermodesulfovibrio sp.]|uniref:NAD-dependent epimerase/dehydratase family protein n=1 Tax=Thermodesulfovibrio sp. TaxID=2067987 RepID=UPI0030A37238
MEKILITGGTGFVGRYVVREALKSGYEVHLIVRNLEKAKKLFPENVSFHPLEIFTDRLNLSSIVEKVKPQYIIHLIGIIQEIKSKGITFEKVHYEYAKILYEAVKQNPPKKIIHMSALGVDENAPSKYHITKLMAEKELIKCGIPYAILRPSFILGPEQLLFLKLKPVMEASPILFFPAIKGYKFQPVDVRDVAEGFIRAIDHKEDAIFELCGNEKVTLTDIVKDYVSQKGKKVLFFPFSKSILGLFAKEQLKMMWRDNICGYSDNVLPIQRLLKREPLSYRESIKWSATANQ